MPSLSHDQGIKQTGMGLGLTCPLGNWNIFALQTHNFLIPRIQNNKFFSHNGMMVKTVLVAI